MNTNTERYLSVEECPPSLRQFLVDCLIQNDAESHRMGHTTDPARYPAMREHCQQVRDALEAIPTADEMKAVAADIADAIDERDELIEQAKIAQAAAERAGREVERLEAELIGARKRRRSLSTFWSAALARWSGLPMQVFARDLQHKGYDCDPASGHVTDLTQEAE